MTPEALKKIVKQVPPNYYARGVRNNIFQRYWHGRKWRILKEFLPKINGQILDIGCADGTTTAQIARILPEAQITGLDYHTEAINFAQKTNQKIKFVVGNAHKLPFKNRSFDLITIMETLEHLENPRQVLAEIHRVLKKNGYLIIGQDTDSLLFKLVWFLWTKWKGYVWTNSHISCMRPKQLLELVKKSGFEIQYFDFVNLRMEIFIKAKKV